MTLKPCQWSPQPLPPGMSCVGLCSDFPDCMPTPSPQKLTEVTRFCRDGQTTERTHQAVADTLSQLYNAITEGLAGREQRNDEDRD